VIAPEWAGMSTARRIAEAIGAPVGWGIVCGLLLAASAPLYIVGALIGVLGGIAGGAQHATLRDAIARAATGGTLFGLAILLGFELSGGEGAEVELPHPPILLIAFTLLPAFPLHWLGWRLARSRTGARRPA
jgi:threonine/homoserine/homoserine lactone efflux protein